MSTAHPHGPSGHTLSEAQREVLHALCVAGSWSPQSSWLWVNAIATARVCDQLERLGYVTAHCPSGEYVTTHQGYAWGQRHGIEKETEPMTPTTTLFRDQLRRLGLTQRAYARALEINDRTVRRWATGDQPIPPEIMLALERSEPGALSWPEEADQPCD